MLKLEAGKRYLKRNGTLTGVLESYSHGGAYIWFDGTVYYLATGRVFANKNNKDDIVSDAAYSESASVTSQLLEWKRGIPTEEECRECWLICGGDGKKPFTMQTMCHGPGVTRRTHWDAKHWYLALRIKPVEQPKPKTKTVTLNKRILPTGEEWWATVEKEVYPPWKKTDETKEVEVPA